jgi:hypothetical protein
VLQLDQKNNDRVKSNARPLEGERPLLLGYRSENYGNAPDMRIRDWQRGLQRYSKATKAL